MRRALRYLAPLIAAFAAVLTLSTSAFAGTVTPGGPFTAATSPWVIGNPVTGVNITCGTLNLGGTLMSSSTPVIGHVSSATATMCSGPAGLTFTMSFLGLPWTVNETTYNATTGVATGTLTGFRVQLSGICKATIAGPGGAGVGGTLGWSHNNSVPQTLTVTSGSLVLYNVTGCLGLLNNGNAVTVGTGAYTLSPPQSIS
ncbi:hypothetical protein [Streptomyces sp. NBC_01477]|uniref:hypothetical protein n=1 Tax=Streptomyces sp. NBC_01477 TaxID=2976015 RepID=UPI002E35D1BB|nr:hypothetical protein [Streptomyces sp. NBC_01477]